MFGSKHPRGVGMFRIAFTLALVLAAVWMFAEGDRFSASYYELPNWILKIPPKVLGGLCIIAAVVAAVVPGEHVEAFVEFLVTQFGGPVSAARSRIPCAKCGEYPPKHKLDCDNNPERFRE